MNLPFIEHTIYSVAATGDNRVTAPAVAAAAAKDGITLTTYSIKKTFAAMSDLGVLEYRANHYVVNPNAPEFVYLLRSLLALEEQVLNGSR